MAASSLDFHEMLNLLQSNDCNVEEIKSMIHDHLKQNKEASHLNLVVDYYLNTSHARYLDILIGIREPHDKHLFDKLNDCLKGRSRLKAMTLLGFVIHRQPTFLHRICQHATLPSIVKILRNDLDVQNVMCGVLVLVTLLPVIPSTVGPFLDDMFAAFIRLASWHTKKPGSIPEVHMMHLHVATYSYFHRLYSMFPCHFVDYLRSYFRSRERQVNFSDTIRPMLERVRLHPSLVISSRDNELSLNRWKSMETHDIVLECANVSLDPNEGIREEQVTSAIMRSALQKLKYSYRDDLTPTSKGFSGRLPQVPLCRDSIIGQAAAPTGWSPSYTCGLATPPPSQQISPSGSYFGPEFLAKITTPTAELRSNPLAAQGELKATLASKSELIPSRGSEPVSEGQQRSEKEDLTTDSEVTSLTGRYRPPLGFHPRSGQCSAQRGQSPYMDSLQGESQRGRSYSQGKRPPLRRGFRYSPLHSRSHSLPDLRPAIQDRQRPAVATVEPTPLPTVTMFDTSEEAIAPLPFQQLFDMTVPAMARPSPGDTHGHPPVRPSVPLFVEMSPPELLDRYLFKSGDLHHTRAPDRSPVAGGAASVNDRQQECDILRGQVQLLHTQLLYERHKRELHAERNRRLQGKAKRAKTLDEQIVAMSKQMTLLQGENITLNATLSDVRNKQHNLVERRSAELATARDSIKRTNKENANLQRVNDELTVKLQETTTQLNKLRKDLGRVQADLFGTHHELQVIQEKVAINSQLRAEIEKLNKELILVMELNQRYHERENLLAERHQYKAEVKMLRDATKHELKYLRSAVKTREMSLDSFRCRVGELEAALVKRDHMITEHKKLLKCTKDEFDVQVRVLEKKYESRGKVCQHLETEILALQFHNDRLQSALSSSAMLRRRDSQREQDRAREIIERGGIPPPVQQPELSSPEQAALLHKDRISYFDDVAEERRAPAPPLLPNIPRRASQPIDIDLTNVAGRARRPTAERRKQKEGGAEADTTRSPAGMDFYGGFEGLPKGDLESQRNYLRRGNEPSVLQSITSQSLAQLIGELEES